ISNCSTASATARRKSPSPAFSNNSANTNLSSVIGSSRVLQVEVWQLHLSRLARWPPQPHRSPTLRINPKIPPRAWTLTIGTLADRVLRLRAALPAQFTDAGFVAFNRHSVERLAAWGFSAPRSTR